MKRSALIAGLLSFFVPGLGQIYARKSARGVAILIAAIVVGNLNVSAVLITLFPSDDGSRSRLNAGAACLSLIPYGKSRHRLRPDQRRREGGSLTRRHKGPKKG